MICSFQQSCNLLLRLYQQQIACFLQEPTPYHVIPGDGISTRVNSLALFKARSCAITLNTLTLPLAPRLRISSMKRDPAPHQLHLEPPQFEGKRAHPFVCILNHLEKVADHLAAMAFVRGGPPPGGVIGSVGKFVVKQDAEYLSSCFLFDEVYLASPISIFA